MAATRGGEVNHTGDDVSDQAYEVPLLELMASVPPKLIAQWTDIDGLQASHHVPVGKYLHAAIGVIRELQGFLQAAEARAAEYMRMRNEAMAVAESNKAVVVHLRSQVDALTKEAHDWSEIAEEQQLRIQAAEARCERYEKAIQTIAEGAPMGDKNPWVWYINVARRAIAEQALADGSDTNRGVKP